MPATRPESSVVSLPPRERALAKRRAKAMRHGISPSLVGKSSKVTKRKAKAAPAPTLASTRKRRAAADFAYLNRPDGFHVKRVVRRPGTPERAPPVPYLPGQEDIPPSDTESDSEPEDTTPELTGTVGSNEPNCSFNVVTEADDTTIPSDYDLLDYDAEGEDEDEDVCMEGITYSNYLASTANGRTHGTDTPALGEQAGFGGEQAWAAGDPTFGSSQSLNLLANTSDEDVIALFGGLDELRLDNSFSGGLSNGMHDPSVWEPFAMNELSAAVNSLEASASVPCLPSLSANLLGIDRPTQPPITTSPQPPSRIPTPAPWIIGAQPQTPNLRLPSTPRHQSTPLPVSISRPAPPSFTPHTGPSRGSNVPGQARPRLTTSERAAQARLQARSRHIPLPPPARSADEYLTRFPLERGTSPVLEPSPLRVSLSVPDFLHSDDSDGEDGELGSVYGSSRPPTPITLEETDIGLDESSPVQATRPYCRASKWDNPRKTSQHRSAGKLRRIPTNAELKFNARRHLKLNRRKNRGRHSHPIPAAETSGHNRGILRAGALSVDQRIAMAPMEYHVHKDIVFLNPWPEDRDVFLESAKEYAIDMTGICDPEVYTPIFMDTVFYRTSANRGNSLPRVECLIEPEYAVRIVDKPELYQLMANDQFLYPTMDRKPEQYFCVRALGAVLTAILFKSSKVLALVFMAELCAPDDPVKCKSWHSQLRDRTALSGVPPGAIAFAATQLYWALEKMYLGTAVHFDEQHYRGVWERYFRILLKLPHLGQLRIDLLDQLKEYYMETWPAHERDEDDHSLPAW
ncbi:hypothetical protein FRC12_000490 [Ceratobasidium sp. 428]|nr:hypothetical protein FRC12_000490 [Ceratobasidium sp. 428]